MLTLYSPCTDCKQKVCHKCAYKAALRSYRRALDKIRELSAKLGQSITILK